jgi:hypothetical protein
MADPWVIRTDQPHSATIFSIGIGIFFVYLLFDRTIAFFNLPKKFHRPLKESNCLPIDHLIPFVQTDAVL